MSDPAFSPGDVVVLKSGGPRMTISSMGSSGKAASCVWFDGKGEMQHSQFMLAAIEHHTPYDPEGAVLVED